MSDFVELARLQHIGGIGPMGSRGPPIYTVNGHGLEITSSDRDKPCTDSP